MSEKSTSTRWALLTAPLRVALALLVFAPVLLVLKAIQKIGEYLEEAGAELEWKWTQLARDTAFILHGQSLEKAKENAQKLRSLEERWRFFHGDDKHTEVSHRAGEKGSNEK